MSLQQIVYRDAPVHHVLHVYVAEREGEGPLFWLETQAPLPAPGVGEHFDLAAWPSPDWPFELQPGKSLVVIGNEVAVTNGHDGSYTCRRTVTIAVGQGDETPDTYTAEDEAATQIRRADWCESAARDLANIVASGPLDQCTSEVVAQMTGRTGGQASVWRDAAEAVQDDGHLLRDMTVADKRRRATAALQALTHGQRVALWLALEPSGSRAGVYELARDCEPDSMRSFDPLTSWQEGMPESEAYIVGRVLGMLEAVDLE